MEKGADGFCAGTLGCPETSFFGAQVSQTRSLTVAYWTLFGFFYESCVLSHRQRGEPAWPHLDTSRPSPCSSVGTRRGAPLRSRSTRGILANVDPFGGRARPCCLPCRTCTPCFQWKSMFGTGLGLFGCPMWQMHDQRTYCDRQLLRGVGPPPFGGNPKRVDTLVDDSASHLVL